jgi:hypothetical protein
MWGVREFHTIFEAMDMAFTATKQYINKYEIYEVSFTPDNTTQTL